MVKNLLANEGDVRDSGSIPGLEKYPGAGHGNPVQYSCLENPMDRGAWRATIHRVTEHLDTTEGTQHTARTHPPSRILRSRGLTAALKMSSQFNSTKHSRKQSVMSESAVQRYYTLKNVILLLLFFFKEPDKGLPWWSIGRLCLPMQGMQV